MSQQENLFDIIDKAAPEDQHAEEPQKANAPTEFSVSEISQKLKSVVEGNFSYIRVRGELSRVTVAKSGHCYTSLKDDKAVLDAICWRGTLNTLSIRPEEGLDVVVTGRLTTYPGRSNYQMIIETMELAGEGALLKMLEERRKKLAAEGLFDESKKKPIPFLPNTVGVVTSPTGAVIRDIMHRLNDRFPRPVYLYPAIVQGDQAAEQVVAGIEFFNKLPMDSIYRPDVLIVGRGGGSLEDLMPFNDERVVRAIAASDIPIISAVGHETDTTLSDFAADLRAPTPTGAAEKAVPVRRDLINTLKQIDGRMHQSINRVVRERHTHISGLSRGLPHPRRMLENMMQRLDGLSSKIDHGLIQFLNIKKQHMTALSARLSLRPYSQKLNYQAENLERLQQRLHQAIKRNVADKANTLSSKAAMLNTLSFERTLERGFALVKDTNGNVITSKATLKTDQNIEVQLKDGKIKADITEV